MQIWGLNILGKDRDKSKASHISRQRQSFAYDNRVAQYKHFEIWDSDKIDDITHQFILMRDN